MVPSQGIVRVTVTTHPRQQGRFLPALAAPAASPRRLTSKRWSDRFPHWLALDTAILTPTNCGWGSLGWRGRSSGCKCCRAPSLFPPTIGDVSEGLEGGGLSLADQRIMQPSALKRPICQWRAFDGAPSAIDQDI